MKSFFRLDTDLKKRRLVGFLIAAALLALFLAFNRIPKLDTVSADLAIATSPQAECFQGFCITQDDDRTLLSRWWGLLPDLPEPRLDGNGVRVHHGRPDRGVFLPGGHQGAFLGAWGQRRAQGRDNRPGGEPMLGVHRSNRDRLPAARSGDRDHGRDHSGFFDHEPSPL